MPIKGCHLIILFTTTSHSLPHPNCRYHATRTEAEVLPMQLPFAAPMGVIPDGPERKPHLMTPLFLQRVRSSKATAISQSMHDCVQASCLGVGRDFAVM